MTDPPLRVDVQVRGLDASARNAAVDEISARVGLVLTRLGISRRVEVSVTPHDDVRPRLTIDEHRVRYAPFRITRARMSVERRLLEPNEIDEDGGLRNAEGNNPVAELSTLIELLLLRNPELLNNPEWIRQVRAVLEPDENEHLEAAIALMVTLGISFGDRSRFEAAWRQLRDTALTRSPRDVAEELVARIHPLRLEVILNSSDLEERLLEDPAGEDAPFAVIHQHAPVPLPDLRLSTSDDVPEGTYQLRVNDLWTTPQPLLPRGRLLRLDAGPGTPVHLPGWGHDARLIDPVDKDAAGSWSTIEHLCVEVLGLTRVFCPRLLDNDSVAEWGERLGRPALVANASRRHSWAKLTSVLRDLAREHVAIFDLPLILQRSVDHMWVETPAPRHHVLFSQALAIDAESEMPARSDRLLEGVRAGLGNAIYNAFAVIQEDGSRLLPVIVLDAAAEDRLASREDSENHSGIINALVRTVQARRHVVILVSVEVRAYLARLLQYELPATPVLSYQELPTNAQLQIVAEIPVDYPSASSSASIALSAVIDRDRARSLGLFLAGDDGRPCLPDGLDPSLLAAAGVSPEMRPFPRRDEFAGDVTADPDDLRRQGWGVIVPTGERGRLLLSAIDELVQYRSTEQGARHWVRDLPPDMDDLVAEEWTRRHFESIPERDRPRYILILGDFDEISLELQQVLGAQAFVGRLALDRTLAPDYEPYRAYAAKAVAAERLTLATVTTHLFAAPGDDLASIFGAKRLAHPTFVDLSRDSETASHLDIPQWLSSEKRAFLDSLDSTGLLFTVSHGLGDSMPYERRLSRQGALVLGPREILSGEDLAARPFLPRGVWFMTACYGAGTPRASTYDGLLRTLGSLSANDAQLSAIRQGQLNEGEKPFVASVPRVALSNPDGPLAIIAHADLAWSHSFLDGLAGRHYRFLNTLRMLLAGHTVGNAHESLMRSCAHATARLVNMIGRPDTRKAAQSELLETWILREDLRGYVVLGDPAARLGLLPKG